MINYDTDLYDIRFSHPIIYNFIISLSSCLSILLLLINKLYYKRKNPNKNYLSIIKENTITNNIPKLVSKKEKFLWFLLVSIINFCSNILYNKYLNMIFASESYYYLISILFLSIFSYKILKYNLYKHHYLGIIIMVVNSIVVIILAYFNSKDNLYNNKSNIFNDFRKYYLYGLLISITSTTLHNLGYVIDKYLIFKKYILSYEILFFEGIIELAFSIIALIITTNAGFIDNYFDFINKLDRKLAIIIILIILFNFIFNSLLITIIDFFSPYYIMLVYISSEIFSSIYMILTSDVDQYFFIVFILDLTNFFIDLVFIEVIEINCFGLSYMTKKNIEIRARLDSFEIEEDNKNKNISKNEAEFKGYIIELYDANNEEFSFESDKNWKET